MNATDNEMPRLTGLQLVKRLRSAGRMMPVIFVSGSLDAEEFLRDDWLRVVATLKKPFPPGDLVETVKQVFRAATAVRKRGEVFFPALAKTFTHITPAPHWGINE